MVKLVKVFCFLGDDGAEGGDGVSDVAGAEAVLRLHDTIVRSLFVLESVKTNELLLVLLLPSSVAPRAAVMDSAS